jgi:hypothetical protein
MLKQFYEKALPTQGVYCITSIRTDKKVTNKFSETLDGVFEQIEKFKSNQLNTFVALGTFDGYSRKADDCLFMRSFFIDLDVGAEKDYQTKGDAHTALYKLVGETGLPDPVVIDSGGGVHAYWIMDEDIPRDDWKPIAEKFKALCLKHISIDPVVTADAARIMRAPETFNHKFDPPEPTSVVSDEIHVYGWQEFREFFGAAPTTEVVEQTQEAFDAEAILASIPKGVDEDTRAILKLDNFAKLFEVLAQKSVDEEGGCAQIKFICENAEALEEPLWHAVLSIAKFCDDGATAIHEISNPDPRYTHAKTEEKAAAIPAPRTCEWFIGNYPSRCEGCQHRGKITSPITLGRHFKPAPATNKEDPVWEVEDTQKVPDFPDFLYPYVRGESGGIYFVPPAKIDKKGVKHQDDPILILTSNLYPLTRMISPHDGECLQMRLELPRDGFRDFLLPMKGVYAKEAFKAIMASNGVLFSSVNDQHLMNYIIKWGQYLQTTDKALQMRMQMGWTHERTDPDWDKRSFVIGKKELTRTGEMIDAPSSPFVRGLSRHIVQAGTFARWRESIDYLNKPEFELHAFASMSGFGSPLMPYTSTSGVTMCLVGRSGNAKTGAMYAGLSVFGHPKDLSIVKATDNGLTGRYLGLHSMMFGLDEVGDKKAEDLGNLIHNVSHGKAKVRMQGSVNAEREYEMSASLIALLTANHSIYGKLEGIKFNPDGESARLIELLIHKPKLLEDEGRLGEYIFDAFKYNYGHAGPMYMKEVITRGDNYVTDHVDKWTEKFLADFGIFTEYRFYQNLVGVNFGGAEIANEHGVTAYDLERIYHQTVLAMIEIRDKVVKVNRADYPSLLGDFINRNMGNILVLKDGKVTMEPRGQIVGRIVSDEGLLQVSKVELKKFLTERQVSLREFEFDMRAKKILFDDKKGRLTTGWKSAISVDPAYLYWFRTQIPGEWLDDTRPD